MSTQHQQNSRTSWDEQGYVFGIPYKRRIHTGARMAAVLYIFVLIIFVLGGYLASDTSSIGRNDIVNFSMALTALCGLLVLCAVYSIDKNPPNDSTPYFYFLMVLDATSLLLYASDWMVTGHLERLVLYHICTVISFLIGPFISITFWCYQNSLYPLRTEFSRRYSMTLLVLFVLDVLLIVTSPATRILYIIDEHGQFQAQDGYMLSVVFPTLMLLSCLVAVTRREIPGMKRLALQIFCVTPVICSISTIFVHDYSYTYVVVFFILILLYGIVQIDRSTELLEQKEELLRKEQELMLSQIQPHFLYNTLTAISYLCDEDKEQAKRAIRHFADYLRGNLALTHSNRMIRFENELEHMNNYLWIEKLRFGDDLNIEYRIGYEDFMLPPLTLQPIIENAVRHGICKKEYGGTVIIETKKQDENVIITITDDGVGFDTAKKLPEKELHVGLANVRYRIELLCSGTMNIDSTIGKGTTVRLTLPQ